MKLLLLGATGRTGKLVLEKALAKGYEVNCLVRKADKVVPQQGLTIIEGNPANTTDLANAISDCDHIISVLNVSRKSDFPWAPLRTPKTYLSDVMKLLIPLAEARQIQRISVCSAWGVAETKADIPLWFKLFIDYSNIGYAYKDHERQEAILSNSKLNWTIVRPVGLTNSNKTTTIQETFNNTPKPNILISRDQVAEYLVNSLGDEQLIGKKVVISKA